MTEFFAYFSRFEFALKQAGYLKNASGTQKAEPNWNAFAKEFSEVHVRFFEDIKGTGHAAELIDKPPAIQMGDLTWKPWSSGPNNQPKDLKQLFEAICCVRNNLFHGGKSSRLQSNRDRDLALLKAGLFILKAALEKCGSQQQGSKLRKAYDEFNEPL